MSCAMNWPQAITMSVTLAVWFSIGDTVVEMKRGDGSGLPLLSLVRGRLPAKRIGQF